LVIGHYSDRRSNYSSLVGSNIAKMADGQQVEVVFECPCHASCAKLVLVECAKPSFRTAPGRFCGHQEAHDY
jgi:hypothetical protein